LPQLVMTTKLDCAPTRLFGLSVTPSVRLSVSKCFAKASTSTGGRSIQFLQFTECRKETLNPAHPTHSLYLTYHFKKHNMMMTLKQHRLTSGITA